MSVIGDRISVSLDQILFATDFSPSAQTAKLYVEALARRYQSQVRLLHVIDIGAAFKAPDAGISVDLFRRAGEKALEALRGEMLAEQIKVQAFLSEGMAPSTEILEMAQDRSVNLLAIGTRGHKGLARLVLGSTAEELIHKVRCPILVIGPHVPPPKRPIAFERIVYATDFSQEAVKACVFALSLAQDFGGHLYLCHVLPAAADGIDDQQRNDQFVSALARLVPDVAREFCEPECVLEHGVASDGILLLAHRLKADLIVLGTRKASHWYDSFKTGVAFQVISGSTCPVLAIPG